MARATYSCGGCGKHGQPPKACTRCGRMHPKGKKQKEAAKGSGWSCKKWAMAKSSSDPVTRDPATTDDVRRRKNARTKARNAARKQERQEKARERSKVWQKLSDKQKKKELYKRPGNCEKQLKKLAAAAD